MQGRVVICNTNEIERDVIAPLLEIIPGTFHVDVRRGPTIEVDGNAYDKQRDQYLTYPMFQELNRIERGSRDLLLVLIDKDLYVPEMNYIFGQASTRLGIALVSLRRLHTSFMENNEDMQLLKGRVVKESIHEMGHLFGLKHCPNRNCVMHFSSCLEDTDRKGTELCVGCRMRL